MIFDENQGADVAPEATDGEGGEAEVETISIPKSDYEKLNQSLGSLKRELKDLKKPKADAETPQKNQPDSNVLLQEAFLTAVGITDDEEVELALTTAKKWDMPINKLVKDDDFRQKLEKHRTAKSNLAATSNVRGDKGAVSQKDTPEFWIAKGTPPTASDVPDRKARAKIARAMMASASSSKKFYSD